MSLSRTWYTDGNIAVVDTSTTQRLAQSILWQLKALLKGEIGTNTHGLWTCVGSSDSSTAGLDAVDRWTSSFDASKLVRANPGSPHSWMVLKSPISLGPYYMCIDWGNGSDTQVNMVFSKNVFTGGSITARPTSTTEWVHTNFVFNNNLAAASKLQRITDADGNFWFFVDKTTDGIFNTTIAFQTLVETLPGDNHTGFSICDFTTGGRGTLTGGSSGIFANSVGGRTYDNSSNFTGSAIGFTANSGGSLTSSMSTANAITASFDTLPVYIWCNVSSYKGIRGRIPDIAIVGDGATVGASEPTTGAQERMVVGNMLVPSSVVPAL